MVFASGLHTISGKQPGLSIGFIIFPVTLTRCITPIKYFYRMKFLVLSGLLCSLIIGSSCGGPVQPKQKDRTATDTTKFYPLRSFLQDQMQYVDLRNFPIYRIRVKDGVRDSVPMSKEAFLSMAVVFLRHDLSEPGLKSRYTETVFQDQSTGSLTLNYSPITANEVVRSIDILLDENTHIVKRVFIRAAYTSGDTSITEQYSWKANKSFQLGRTLQTGKGFTSTETNFVNWNDIP